MTAADRRLVPLALVLLTAAVFLPTVTYPLVYEDLRALPQAHPHFAWWDLVGYLQGDSYALTTWTFDRQAGWGPGWFHLVNVGIHLANGLLLWDLLRRGLPPGAAALAAMIFLIHPLQIDAVSYVSGRADLLVGLGWLIAARGKWWQVVPGVAVACLAKPSGALALLPLAMLVWVMGTRRQRQWLATGASLLILVALTRLFRHPNPDRPELRIAQLIPATDWAVQSWAAIQLHAVGRWWLQFFVPYGISVDPGTALLGPTWAVEVAAVLAVWWAWVASRIDPQIRLLVLWTIACAGWRLIPTGEVFGAPGDGYLLIIAAAGVVALAVSRRMGEQWPNP